MSDEAETLLVVGASGRVGSRVLASLCRAGKPVRAVVAPGDTAGVPRLYGIPTIMEGDIACPAFASRALEGIRRAFFSFPPTVELLPAARTFAKVASEHRLDLVVHLSQFLASPRHECQLTSTQGEAELELTSAAEKVYHLCANLFAEQYVELTCDLVAMFGEIWLPVETGRIAPISCEDVADVAASLVLGTSAPSSSHLLLTGGQSVSQQDCAVELTRILDHPVRHANVDKSLWTRTAMMAGHAPILVHHLLHAARDVRSGLYDRVTDDVTQILGRAPVEFFQILRDHEAAYRLGSGYYRKRQELRHVQQRMVGSPH